MSQNEILISVQEFKKSDKNLAVLEGEYFQPKVRDNNNQRPHITKPVLEYIGFRIEIKEPDDVRAFLSLFTNPDFLFLFE